MKVSINLDGKVSKHKDLEGRNRDGCHYKGPTGYLGWRDFLVFFEVPPVEGAVGYRLGHPHLLQRITSLGKCG